MAHELAPEEKEEIVRRINEWSDGDRPFRDKTLSDFLDFYPKMIQTFKEYRETGDLQGMIRAAHSLKSTLSFLGATSVFLSAKETEEALIANDPRYHVSFEALTAQLNLLGSYLRSIIEEN